MQCSCKIRYRDHRNGLGSEDSSPNSSRLGTLSSRELLPERIHDPSGATPLPTPRSEEFAVGPGAQSTGPVALVSGPSSLQSTKPSREAAVVVVSNRLPFTITRTAGGLDRSASSGGLVSALGPVLRGRGGTWVGWPGIDLNPHEVLPLHDESYEIKALYLDEREVTHYVHGFSNRTLWPLMHSLPARTRFDRLDFKVYWEVNERFADAAVTAVSGDDLIWIHDYHLMLAPEFVRQRLPRVRLAFFHQVPFPPYDIFRLLPWDRELLRGLLACDLVGFHVKGYADNFLDCVEKRLGSRVDRKAMIVEHGKRTVQVGVFPIGIAFDDFERRAKNAAPRSRPDGERMVLGLDRLDYTKGIPERIRSFERLLELHPEHRGTITLLQLAVPSRSQVAEYRELKREIDELVGRVNGRFATSRWSPIRYLFRSINNQELASLYRDADVALVTPLRDGMNLVAKEFVASQVGDPGVLILSRMAGAAETMREALLVNPYNIDETAEAIHRAITMDEHERSSRIAALRKREARDDISSWVDSFLDAAARRQTQLSPISGEDFQLWLGTTLNRPRLALFLDYDGTLSEIQSHPSDAIMTESMRIVLARCAERPDTDVAIISGRGLDDVKQIVDMGELTYAANHGLEITGPQIDRFTHEDLIHYQDRTLELTKALEEVHLDGAWTEAKGATLTYHYRGVSEGRWPELASRAHDIIIAAGFQARAAHCSIEARPPIGWDKGRAALHILRSLYGPSWSEQVRVIYVGDDQTDEDAFRLLSGLAYTFRVGPADSLTAATRMLPNVDSVCALLGWLANRPPQLDLNARIKIE